MRTNNNENEERKNIEYGKASHQNHVSRDYFYNTTLK